MIRRGGTRMFGDGRRRLSSGFSETDSYVGEIQGNKIVPKLTRHVIA